MSKSIKVAYADIVNAGDLLNVDLIEKLSGCKVVRSKVYNADMLAIGGAFYGLQYSDGVRCLMQKGLGIIYGRKPLYIWGSGFYFGDRETKIYRHNLKVCALRGRKSLDKLMHITGKSYDVVLADAGLLIDMLLENSIEKKYKIGVIPHFSQQDEFIFQEAKKNSEYHFIDIKNTPKEVAEEIASCELIASSSLHGLIFADGMHIPSLRIVGKTKLGGGEFKFEDYYSCYGIKDDPWYDQEKLPTKEDILKRYSIDFTMVDQKKKALVECFPILK